ncbi:DUF6496 domain-containing protein [Methylobacterium trifolii]|uniref:Rho termination factor n=1 Tax=Methylobacterium trifolii TaxID=1003092 RepID=A0ABQ4U100_9HYPH|nr:DUF6496 domain-containing protein [Methylobacterium trifolii]GJE60456.1 hypothetical protein MPOCJGCO_2568 [Methylobacterium trifolii]
MTKPSKAQDETVGRVMHAFKHGDLKTGGNGPPVKSRKQAIAIALHEAGATNRESPAENRAALRRTKAKERAKEQVKATDGESGGASEPTKAALYAEARRRGITGRSTMSKAALQAALR